VILHVEGALLLLFLVFFALSSFSTFLSPAVLFILAPTLTTHLVAPLSATIILSLSFIFTFSFFLFGEGININLGLLENGGGGTILGLYKE